jgi:rhodanese-related sulfurtransferase
MKHHPAFLSLVESTRLHVKESDCDGLQQRLMDQNPFILIDVREESEFSQGHIPGAIWLGKGIIERDIEALCPDKDSELWLYCGGGYRSVLAAHNLQQMGYTRVISVDGGFRAWKELDLPIQR